METFCVRGAVFSQKNPLIIAELGTAHGGNICRAKELIAAAAESGAGCVKTQIVFADEILHPNTGTVPLPGGPAALYDVFKSLEAPFEFFDELKRYAGEKGLLFLASPFGPKSAALLRRLNCDFVKAASPELNWTALLKELASWNVPMLISSGVSKLGDIETALEAVRGDGRGDRRGITGDDRGASVCLLHCVTAYPAPAAEYNLSILPFLSGIFGVPCGLSDHSAETSLVPLLAISRGACVIEKHFCISRQDGGLDDPIALCARDFSIMCGEIRAAAALEPCRIIERAVELYGAELVQACLGDGKKRLAVSEAANYNRTNRSIHALRTIKKDELITRDMIAVLRTEKKLRPGLSPDFFELLPGHRARAEIPSGEGIRFEDI